MSVLNLRNVYVGAGDVGKLSAFYEKALGLKLAFADADRWHQFKLSNTTLAVSSVQESGLPAGSGFVPVFEVADIDATRAEVLAAGGQLGQRRDMGSHGVTLAVQDVAGNHFQLFQKAVPA